MDRDAYLILLGAGISLASSIVTLVLQFLLSQWSEKLRAKREGREWKAKELRAALLDKSEPVRIPNPEKWMGRLLGGSGADEIDLDLPSFLRRRKTDGVSEPVVPITPLQYWRSVAIGVVIFVVWVFVVIFRQ